MKSGYNARDTRDLRAQASLSRLTSAVLSSARVASGTLRECSLRFKRREQCLCLLWTPFSGTGRTPSPCRSLYLTPLTHTHTNIHSLTPVHLLMLSQSWDTARLQTIIQYNMILFTPRLTLSVSWMSSFRLECCMRLNDTSLHYSNCSRVFIFNFGYLNFDY